MKNTLNEGVGYKDMVGLVKPTLFVDEFSSKIADDSEIAVLSLYVRSSQVADDLITWFENGYEYILDADRSPGEIKPNRYLVFVEIERKHRLIKQIKELLEDLGTLTEHKLMDYKITYNGKSTNYDHDKLEDMIFLTSIDYRMNAELELNEMRTAANLPAKKLARDDEAMNQIRMQAGLL